MCLRNFGNLTKKIYCSLLSGALLFVLFALSQNCYAREVTSEDIANAIYNIAYARGVTLTQSNIDLTTCQTIANGFNANQGHYLICNGGGVYENSIYFYLLKGKPYYVSGTVYATSSTEKIVYNISNKYFIQTSFAIGNPDKLGSYSYNDGDIYSSYNGNTISFSAGTMRPSNFDVFADVLYPNTYFAFNYDSNLLDISVDDFNLMKQIDISDIDTRLADFGQFSLLDTTLYKPKYTIWKYQKPENYFVPIISYDYNGYSEVNNDLGHIYVFESMFIPNTIIEINLWPTDLDTFSPLSILFYCVDSNSVIFTDSDTGYPTLDNSSTFNNDYYKKYSNLINNLISTSVGNIISPSGDVTGTIDFSPITQGIIDINNTLTDGSQTANIINSYISGDLPDVFGYQENFKTEYNLYWSPLNYLTTQIFNALTLNSTAEFHIPLRNGQTLVLSSDQFFVPEGPLKSFIRLYLVFATIYVVFLSFRRLINNLNSGGVNAVLEKQGVDPDYIKM